MKKADQAGFTVVEALLILVIVSILGFTSWFVYHSKQVTDKTLATTVDSSADNSNVRPSSAHPALTHYLTIKEWGVQAPYDGQLHLTYSLVGEDAKISSNELVSEDVSCKDFGGTIGRYKAGQSAEMPFFVGTMTPEQYVAADPGLVYGKVSNYFYFFIHPTSACGSDPDKTNVLQQQTEDAAQALVKQFKAAS